MKDKIVETSSFLRDKGIVEPQVGIILGTGLGKLVHEILVEINIPYEEIPHFPLSTVESHKGCLIYGELENKKVLAMQGRFHFYEGYSMEQLTFPVRVMKELGIEKLLVSNAAGALNPAFRKGDIMLLDDHINFLPDNPLKGINDESMGPRFPDMSRPYSKEMNGMLKTIAEKNEIALHEGVYVAVMGPNLETRAEYRMFRSFADAVGMSTVPEVIVSNHMGLDCCAVSVLTDECDPDNLHPVDISEILEIAGKAEVKMIILFKELVKQL
ncbi:MAG: purine-nucleoside phosphorylase [Bacteroidales bacterium]|nr:purine-nucleoside phosphorylase [Bacteroidales bacterium]